MGGMTAVQRRIKYELALIGLLAVTAALLLMMRGCGKRPPMAGEATPAPSAPVEETTTAEVPAEPVGGEMFEWKEGEYVLVQRGTGTSTEIDESRFSDLSGKNAADLAAWAEMAWDNQWGYVWGTFGNVLDEDLLQYKLDQYGDAVEEYELIIREKWMGRRVADCTGLIKGYGWYDPAQHSISYDYGDMPDIGTDGFYETAPDKGPIDTMPDEPGLLVYSDKGHIGVYIGGGWAIEAISHAGGVVKTRVADRPWTHWLQCPYIQY